jgi:transposase
MGDGRCCGRGLYRAACCEAETGSECDGRDCGKDALRARPVPGRPPKLGGPQLARLYALIAGQDPRQLQFEFALWTREMIREVIRREFRVALSVVSVGRLLRKLGLSPQRPLHRAYQQDPEAVQRWKKEAYPAIRKEAEAAGAVIYFADEAGIRSDYHAGTTWSPVGQTPVVKNTGSRFSVNMISAISAKGALRFAVYDGNTTATFIDFCKRLLHDAAGPVYLIVDGHPAHRATATKEFAASTDGQLRLISCPDTHPSSILTNGSGSTSSRTGSARPVSPAKPASSPRPSAPTAPPGVPRGFRTVHPLGWLSGKVK